MSHTAGRARQQTAATAGRVREQTAATAGRVREQTAAWVKEQIAYIYGMYGYAYGFPLVMMDVTRQVMTAAPRSGEYSAPVNQFHRIRDFVSPDFKNVVRISRNSLWSTAFVDLDAEPVVFSHPATNGRYLVAQVMDMWTDNFASIGSRTTGEEPGHCLIAGPAGRARCRQVSGRRTVARRDTPGCWCRSPPPVRGTSPRCTRSRTG